MKIQIKHNSTSIAADILGCMMTDGYFNDVDVVFDARCSELQRQEARIILHGYYKHLNEGANANLILQEYIKLFDNVHKKLTPEEIKFFNFVELNEIEKSRDFRYNDDQINRIEALQEKMKSWK